MLESLRDGIVGLLLFAGNWILPQSEQPQLLFVSARPARPAVYEVTLRLDLAMNRQLEQLIDAGVPLRLEFSAVSPDADTVSMLRVLKFDIVNYTYAFTDTLHDTSRVSKNYPIIPLALQDFCRWNFQIQKGGQPCRGEVEILPSRVSQLNRSVDMSRIWGQKKVMVEFTLAEKAK